MLVPLSSVRGDLDDAGASDDFLVNVVIEFQYWTRQRLDQVITIELPLLAGRAPVGVRVIVKSFAGVLQHEVDMISRIHGTR